MATIQRGNTEYFINFYTKRGGNLQLLKCVSVYNKEYSFSINKCSDNYNSSIHLAINDYEYYDNKYLNK